MTTYPNIPTGRAELETRIVRRAQEDPAFRARLLEDPRAAVADLLGVTLPERLQIEVVAERPDLMCIVLPVDLSGMGWDAVWAMIGYRPPGMPPLPAKPAGEGAPEKPAGEGAPEKQP